MKRKLVSAAAVASAGLLAAGVAPAQAMTGGKCTTTYPAGNNTISRAVTDGTLQVLCFGGGTDVLTLTSVPASPSASTRFVLVKSAGSLQVKWEGGPSTLGNNGSEFTIIRTTNNPVITVTNDPVTGNSDGGGATAVCGTNVQYAQAANYTAFLNLPDTGTIDWYKSGTFKTNNQCYLPLP